MVRILTRLRRLFRLAGGDRWRAGARGVRRRLRRLIAASGLRRSTANTAPGTPASNAEIRSVVRRANDDHEAFAATYSQFDYTMLSPAEAYCLFTLTESIYERRGSIVELGAYTGGTTCIFGEALRRRGVNEPELEVYDYFLHNPTSRRRLASHPRSNDDDFFGVWEENTQPYRDLVRLHRGDLRETVRAESGPVEFLFVDIVKNEVLINPVMQHCVPRLVPGGLLMHQDYFHWQSPWVVYATEKLIEYLVYLGSVSNHTAIFRLTGELPERLRELDYVADISWDEKMSLMDAAIGRFSGVRAALLEVSRLNLGLDCPGFDFAGEAARVREQCDQARVLRYLGEVEKVAAKHTGQGRQMW